MSSEVATNAERGKVVWIVNRGGHNYEDAEQYGRLMSLTTDNVNPFNLDRMMVLIRPRLIHATKEDYVLISGSPILNAVVIAMWLERFSQVNILQWSIRGGKYIHLFLDRKTVQLNAHTEMRVAD